MSLPELHQNLAQIMGVVILPTKERNPQQRAADRRRDEMVEILLGAALNASICPSLSELSSELDCSPQVASNDLAALHKAGRIRLHGDKTFRQVEIDGHITLPLSFGVGHGVIPERFSPTVTQSDFSGLMMVMGYRFEDDPRACKPARRINPQPVPARSGGGVSTYGV